MASDYEIRSVASGFQLVEYHGCEAVRGRVDHATADRIVKHSVPTRAAAEAKIPKQ